MNEIGFRIKLLRKEFELTQKDMANRIFVTPSYLSRLESCTENPSEKLITLIAYEFGIRIEWLKNGEGDMYSDTYEFDRDECSRRANRTLLDIMTLLAEDSNSVYANVENSLYYANKLIKYSIEGRSYNTDYLKNIGVLFANIERCFANAQINNTCRIEQKFIDEVVNSLNTCINDLLNYKQEP